MMKKKERKVTLSESQFIKAFKNAFMTSGSAENITNNIFEDSNLLNENDDDENEEEPEENTDKIDKVTDEQLRIESLKIAIKIAKQMNKVIAEDLLEISTKVASFLKNHKVGTEYVPDDTDTPLENDGEENEEKPDENAEDLESGEDFTLDDVDLAGEEEPADVEENPEEEESEDANEAGSDIPEEFIL